jgi:hypothetical protein
MPKVWSTKEEFAVFQKNSGPHRSVRPEKYKPFNCFTLRSVETTQNYNTLVADLARAMWVSRPLGANSPR